MKKTWVAIALLCSMATATVAQIPVTPIKILTEEELKKTPYDDSKNYLGHEVYGYMNEELFLPHRPEAERGYGWEHFVKEPAEKLTALENIYEVDLKSERTKYEAVANKVFKVVDIVKPAKGHWGGNHLFFLKLEEKTSKEKMLYVYDLSQKEKFPFIVMNYYNRLKKDQVGQSFIFANRYIKSKKDVKTGRSITFVKDETWKCIDVTLDGNDYQLSLLLQNGRGNTILSSTQYAITEAHAYKQKDVERYRNKFTEKEWDKILNSEIEVGFTHEMVRLAWGEPSKISRSTDGQSWAYRNTLLHFKEGKLESYY